MNKNTHRLRWDPPEHISVRKHGVYLLHGAGEHAARYEHLAQALARAGFRVGAHDHPGHGRSAGDRGVIDPPGALVTQAAIQIQRFAAETGSEPVLFGHSLGGVAASELVLEHRLPVAGLILSSPAFTPFISMRDRVLVSVLWHIAPGFTVKRPYDASRLTHDEHLRQQAEADPLNHGFKSASLVNWLFSSGQRQLRDARMLNVDTLLLIAPDDPVVDAQSMHLFASAAGSNKVSVRVYDNSLHEILNETPDLAERARGDITQWLELRYPEVLV